MRYPLSRGQQSRPRARAMASSDCYRTAVASSGALDGSRSEAVNELILLFGDKFVKDQILVVVDTMLGLQFGMDRKGKRLVGVGHDFNRPGVSRRQRKIFLDHPTRGVEADTGFAAVEAIVVLHPKRTPAGV